MHTETRESYQPLSENLDAVLSRTRPSQPGLEPEWLSEPEIMIVTDQYAFSQALGTALKEQDCQIFLAPEFSTAVDDLQNYSFDLLVIQVSRSNPAGMAAIRQAKHAGAKVIVISGPQGRDFPLESFELEVDDYLIFPFTMAQLRRKVAALLASAPVRQERSRAEEVNARVLKSLQFLMAEIRTSLVRAVESLNGAEDGSRPERQASRKMDEILREISHAIGLTDVFQRKTSHLAQFSDW
ncbi:MAG: response regulator [Deltaproteobacteria bacterium]|nr:response regulator [Deltaproteobacteria bacterium]